MNKGSLDYLHPLQKRFLWVYNPSMEVVKAPNLSLLTKAHENKWVAFSLDYKQLLAVADSLVNLRTKVGQEKSVVMHVLPADVGYAPTVR